MKHVGLVCQTNPDRGPDKMIYNRVDDRLVQAVEQAGLLPVLIPVTGLSELADYMLRLDGLILSGTSDIAPFFYGQEMTQNIGPLDLTQDQFELTMLKQAIGSLPVLGIERGAQLLNIALGGSLKPINSRISHDGPETCYHSLSTRRGSLMQQVLGGRLIVESNHRFQIAELGKNMRWSAKAPDGIIEAIEHQSLPLLGVQFPLRTLIPELAEQLLLAFGELL